MNDDRGKGKDFFLFEGKQDRSTELCDQLAKTSIRTIRLSYRATYIFTIPLALRARVLFMNLYLSRPKRALA